MCYHQNLTEINMGRELSSGPVWVVQGRDDYGSQQEPMGFCLYIFLRDRIVFIFGLGFVFSLYTKSLNY